MDPDGKTPWFISGWNNSYLITQQGNTCAVVSTAVSLSILTGNQFTQADIQPVFFHTYDARRNLPVDKATGYITMLWNPNTEWRKVNTALGVIPIEQAFGINTMFPGQVKATFTQGSRADLMTNLNNGCPTMITIALPGSDIGHVIVVIGYDPATKELHFFNPASGKIESESDILLGYDKGRGFKTFDDLWTASNFWIPPNSMVTVSSVPPIPVSGGGGSGLGLRARFN